MSIPLRVSLRRLIELLRLSGWRIQAAVQIPPKRRAGIAVPRIVRITRHSGANDYFIDITVDDPALDDPLDFEIDTGIYLPNVRRRLRLAERDGVGDNEFFRHW